MIQNEYISSSCTLKKTLSAYFSENTNTVNEVSLYIPIDVSGIGLDLDATNYYSLWFECLSSTCTMKFRVLDSAFGTVLATQTYSASDILSWATTNAPSAPIASKTTSQINAIMLRMTGATGYITIGTTMNNADINDNVSNATNIFAYDVKIAR